MNKYCIRLDSLTYKAFKCTGVSRALTSLQWGPLLIDIIIIHFVENILKWQHISSYKSVQVTYSGGSDCFNTLGFMTSSAPQKFELLITLQNCRLDAIFILW